MVNKFNLNEKYNQLYTQYGKLFETMLSKEQLPNLSTRTVIELSLLTKEAYPNKARAITRANSLFSQEQSLDNLKELLNLYEFIKSTKL